MKKFLVLYMVTTFGYAQAALPHHIENDTRRIGNYDTSSTTSGRSYIEIACEDTICGDCVKQVVCNGCGLCQEGACCQPVCCQPKPQYFDLDIQG